MAVLHLGFHVTHLGGFGVADAIGELISLAILLVLPGVALWAISDPGVRAAGHGDP
jgi:hypothetical protein